MKLPVVSAHPQRVPGPRQWPAGHRQDRRGAGALVARAAQRTIPRSPSSASPTANYASFVVEAAATPLPEVATRVRHRCGHQPGLPRSPTPTTPVETSCNPKHLHSKSRKLRSFGAEENPLCRKDPRNRNKTRRKVAIPACQGGACPSRLSPQAGPGVGSREPSDPRRGPQHRGDGSQLAGWRVRSPTPDGRSSCGSSARNADRYGRTLHRVSRWLASSKTCSTCAHRLDALPLQIRTWTCPRCRAVHDRDHNAAKNVLAAGRAERINASHTSGHNDDSRRGGASVRPQPVAAVADEAGSTPTTAEPPRESPDFFSPGARQ